MSIVGMAPNLKEILLSEQSIAAKKAAIRNWLSLQLAETYEENPNIPPLEYILRRDAIDVFRKILSQRNENLSGYSLIQYVDNLMSDRSVTPNKKPSPSFLAELEHLIKGITGKSGIYDEKLPAFIKYEGAKAAKMRSADLSRMARAADQHMQKYTGGLENDTIRRRSRNKFRILKHFDATEWEWEKWQWHVRHIIRDADVLRSRTKNTKRSVWRGNTAFHLVSPHTISLCWTMRRAPIEIERCVPR